MERSGRQGVRRCPCVGQIYKKKQDPYSCGHRVEPRLVGEGFVIGRRSLPARRVLGAICAHPSVWARPSNRTFWVLRALDGAPVENQMACGGVVAPVPELTDVRGVVRGFVTCCLTNTKRPEDRSELVNCDDQRASKDTDLRGATDYYQRTERIPAAILRDAFSPWQGASFAAWSEPFLHILARTFTPDKLPSSYRCGSLREHGAGISSRRHTLPMESREDDSCWRHTGDLVSCLTAAHGPSCYRCTLEL